MIIALRSLLVKRKQGILNDDKLKKCYHREKIIKDIKELEEEKWLRKISKKKLNQDAKWRQYINKKKKIKRNDI